MDTLKDIIDYNDNALTFVSLVDSSTPAGHFQVKVNIRGRARIFLLEGVERDQKAIIKGCIEFSKNRELALARRGNRVFGGRILGVLKTTNYKKTFESMAR